jgi:hypothetical protein
LKDRATEGEADVFGYDGASSHKPPTPFDKLRVRVEGKFTG